MKLNNKYRHLTDIELSIAFPPDIMKTFRPGVLLMFLLILIILLFGNFWAADEFKNKLKDHNKNIDQELSNINATP
ncbi:unnamed protein product, partial [Rotaria magnacalcarata]